jgi:hypothetical protein
MCEVSESYPGLVITIRVLVSSAKHQSRTLKMVTTTFAKIHPRFVAYNHLIPNATQPHKI